MFFTSGEADEATSPSFAIRYMIIEALSASLEALIAGLLLDRGTTKEATFLMAIKLLITIGSLYCCADGKRATPLSCASIDAYNALL